VDGMPFAKKYNDKDFTALKELTALGFFIHFISGDEKVNRPVIENRNYTFHFARGVEKSNIAENILNASPTSTYVAAIGDDIFDFSMLKKANMPYCPSNAHWYIKQYCEIHGGFLKTPGGGGCIKELAQNYSRHENMEALYEKVKDLDGNERF